MFLAIINDLFLIIAITAVFVLWVAYRNTLVEKTNLAAQLIVEKEKAFIAASEHEKQKEEAEMYQDKYGKVCLDWCVQYNKANKLEKVLEEAALRY